MAKQDGQTGGIHNKIKKREVETEKRNRKKRNRREKKRNRKERLQTGGIHNEIKKREVEDIFTRLGQLDLLHYYIGRTTSGNYPEKDNLWRRDKGSVQQFFFFETTIY